MILITFVIVIFNGIVKNYTKILFYNLILNCQAHRQDTGTVASSKFRAVCVILFYIYIFHQNPHACRHYVHETFT